MSSVGPCGLLDGMKAVAAPRSEGASQLGLCFERQGNPKTVSFQANHVYFCCQFP